MSTFIQTKAASRSLLAVANPLTSESERRASESILSNGYTSALPRSDSAPTVALREDASIAGESIRTQGWGLADRSDTLAGGECESVAPNVTPFSHLSPSTHRPSVDSSDTLSSGGSRRPSVKLSELGGGTSMSTLMDRPFVNLEPWPQPYLKVPAVLRPSSRDEIGKTTKKAEYGSRPTHSSFSQTESLMRIPEWSSKGSSDEGAMDLEPLNEADEATYEGRKRLKQPIPTFSGYSMSARGSHGAVNAREEEFGPLSSVPVAMPTTAGDPIRIRDDRSSSFLPTLRHSPPSPPAVSTHSHRAYPKTEEMSIRADPSHGVKDIVSSGLLSANAVTGLFLPSIDRRGSKPLIGTVLNHPHALSPVLEAGGLSLRESFVRKPPHSSGQGQESHSRFRSYPSVPSSSVGSSPSSSMSVEDNIRKTLAPTSPGGTPLAIHGAEPEKENIGGLSSVLHSSAFGRSSGLDLAIGSSDELPIDHKGWNSEDDRFTRKTSSESTGSSDLPMPGTQSQSTSSCIHALGQTPNHLLSSSHAAFLEKLLDRLNHTPEETQLDSSLSLDHEHQTAPDQHKSGEVQHRRQKSFQKLRSIINHEASATKGTTLGRNMLEDNFSQTDFAHFSEDPTLQTPTKFGGESTQTDDVKRIMRSPPSIPSLQSKHLVSQRGRAYSFTSTSPTECDHPERELASLMRQTRLASLQAPQTSRQADVIYAALAQRPGIASLSTLTTLSPTSQRFVEHTYITLAQQTQDSGYGEKIASCPDNISYSDILYTAPSAAHLAPELSPAPPEVPYSFIMPAKRTKKYISPMLKLRPARDIYIDEDADDETRCEALEVLRRLR